MTVRAALRDGWHLLRRRALAIFSVAFAVFLVVDLFLALLDPSRGWGEDVAYETLLWTTAISVAGYAVASAVLLELFRQVREEGTATATAVVRRAVRIVPMLFAVTAVATVGILAGLVLLVVPGILLLVWWALSYQAVVLESRDWFAALGRSRELVRGHFWTILGLLAVVEIPMFVLDYTLWRLSTSVLPETYGAWVGGALADGVWVALTAATTTAAYWRLTAAADG